VTRAVDAVTSVNGDYAYLTEEEQAQRRFMAEPFAKAMLDAGFRLPTPRDMTDAIAASPDGAAALQSNWLRELLARAVEYGAAAMAHQISEDSFGGNAQFTAQFENPFRPSADGESEELTLPQSIRWYLGWSAESIYQQD
jgi:hypothetical protein